MKKEINAATVAKRMGRILQAYKEQNSEDAASEATNDAASSSSSSSSTSSTPSSFGQMVYTTKHGLELHKKILNFAVQNDSDSESDVSSYSLIESPPKRRRRQPIQAVKRAAVKTTAVPTKRIQRKVTCTSTSNTPSEQSNSLSEQSNSPTDASTSPMKLDISDSDEPDTSKTIFITTTQCKLKPKTRRRTKKIGTTS